MSYESPFESVRGPVITVFDQAVPKVTGKGDVWAGYGKMKVETRIVHERAFWLLLPDGQHYHCDLGSDPMPAMLPTHDVEVKVADGIIHAIINHTTGERMVYRDDSPGSLYRPEQTPAQLEVETGIRTFAVIFVGAICFFHAPGGGERRAARLPCRARRIPGPWGRGLVGPTPERSPRL